MGESGRGRRPRPSRLGGFSGEKPEAASPAFRRGGSSTSGEKPAADSPAFRRAGSFGAAASGAAATPPPNCPDGGVTPWRHCGVGFCSSVPTRGSSFLSGLSSGLPGLPSGMSVASAGLAIGGGLGTEGLGTDGGPAPARTGGERIGPAPNRLGGDPPSCDEIRPCTQEVVGADTMPEGGEASASLAGDATPPLSSNSSAMPAVARMKTSRPAARRGRSPPSRKRLPMLCRLRSSEHHMRLSPTPPPAAVRTAARALRTSGCCIRTVGLAPEAPAPSPIGIRACAIRPAPAGTSPSEPGGGSGGSGGSVGSPGGEAGGECGRAPSSGAGVVSSGASCSGAARCSGAAGRSACFSSSTECGPSSAAALACRARSSLSALCAAVASADSSLPPPPPPPLTSGGAKPWRTSAWLVGGRLAPREEAMYRSSDEVGPVVPPTCVVGRLGIPHGVVGTYARGGSRLVDLLNGWTAAAAALPAAKFGMRCWMRKAAVGSGMFCSCMSRATDEPRARPCWLVGREPARPALMMPRWTGTAGKPRAPSPTSSGEGANSWAADCCEKLSAAGAGGKHLPLPPVLMPLPPSAGRGRTPPSEDCMEAAENLPAMLLSPAGALSSEAALDRR